MEKISVIVPVYKVESYLPSCIESVLSQTFPCLELILVDDGSPDQCGEICEAYARKDERVHVIHQRNAGLSAARNAGVDAATGAYITFLDSDDLLHPQTLELMMSSLQTGAEISICSISRSAGLMNREQYSSNMIMPEMINGLEACWRMHGIQTNSVEPLRGDDCAKYITSTGKLIPRRIFEDIRFPVGRVHEDEFTTYHFYMKVERISVLSEPLYYYRPNPQGIMATRDLQSKKDYIFALAQRSQSFESKGWNDLANKTRSDLSWSATEFAIYSKAAHQKNTLPKELKVPWPVALRRMRHNCSSEQYLRYLKLVTPSLAKVYRHLSKR